MVVEKIGEHFAAHAKIRVVAVVATFGSRQRETNFREFGEAGVWLAVGHISEL